MYERDIRDFVCKPLYRQCLPFPELRPLSYLSIIVSSEFFPLRPVPLFSSSTTLEVLSTGWSNANSYSWLVL